MLNLGKIHSFLLFSRRFPFLSRFISLKKQLTDVFFCVYYNVIKQGRFGEIQSAPFLFEVGMYYESQVITGFMILSAALVFFMTPGLAFFYGGLVRRKNVCSTMMACTSIMGLSVVMWVLFGYSLSFWRKPSGVLSEIFRWLAFPPCGNGRRTICRHHSPFSLCCFSNDVCHDYPCLNHRFSGRAHEI